jgi:hypothetical protein
MQVVLSVMLAWTMAQAAPAATGRLSGRVTAEGTNAPVVGARVMIFPMIRPTTMRTGPIPIAMPPQGTTDQDGRFVFNNLAPGEYRIDVQKTGFASLVDPMTRPTTYTLAAGQALDNINIVLQRGAVIAGKVLDAKGEPLSDVRVVAMRRMAAPPRSNMPPRLVPAPMQGPQQTNDIGEFRITGLPAGEYFVAASPRAMGFGGPGVPASTGSGGGALTPTTTYYPGTADQAGAQPITLAAGAEVSNIFFSIQSAPAYRISGIVVDENGAPIARAMVMLMNDPRTNGAIMMGPGGNAQSGEDGRFSIGDVTPGTYRLNASVPVMVTGGVIGGSSVAAGGAGSASTSFTSWSISGGSGGGVTTTTTTMVNTSQQPQEVVVADADVSGLRVVARRPQPPPQ